MLLRCALACDDGLDHPRQVGGDPPNGATEVLDPPPASGFSKVMVTSPPDPTCTTRPVAALVSR